MQYIIDGMYFLEKASLETNKLNKLIEEQYKYWDMAFLNSQRIFIAVDV